MRSEGCVCGCDMKIAECRVNDPKCAFSRSLSDYVVREASAGKSAGAIKAGLAKIGSEISADARGKAGEVDHRGDPVRGPANAKVTIVEFSDFQCPVLREGSGRSKAVDAEIPQGRAAGVEAVSAGYPLPGGNRGGGALSAQAQGKFWELHDKMYANFRTISRDRIFAWAKEIGIDTDKLRADLDSHKYASRVQAESNEGDNAGVEGTPTFFINGKRLNLSFEVATVAPLITEALKH